MTRFAVMERPGSMPGGSMAQCSRGCNRNGWEEPGTGLGPPSRIRWAKAHRMAVSPTHVLPTVCRQVGAGDPGGLIGNEEGDRIGDFLWGAEAAGGDLRHDLGTHFLRDGHHHVGADVAG